MKEKTEKRWQ